MAALYLSHNHPKRKANVKTDNLAHIMRIGVISDVHGNLEALHAVLADIARSEVNAIICLGDMIGYGPDSDKVVRTIQALGISTIMGNHELGAIDASQLKWFNPAARESLKQAIKMLSAESLSFISGLKPVMLDFGFRFVHAFPPDSVKTYLFAVSDDAICRAFEIMPQRVCFVGHTHLLELIAYNGSSLSRKRLPEGITRLSADQQYVINVGSVGQPRDGNHDAKYVIYDIDNQWVVLRQVAYDIDAVVDKMKAAGFPKALALRLR
ncbi:MAG: metallophosphoesterase family protein [Desulfobacterales bacterium]|nr:metallophosphoesterase family protein [Desulfobacterales bacterium]